ncbi:hypothetical protein [Sediminibacterium sp.]|uniref:hypothetical protein n=1 Tax=Sediminibacterium sp. TaxID=1917865 RepID=UPI0027363CA8|nr:hypothetical protein [Sediminibacterium sp.]MDP3394894.1 hypothetical protein [Sediminibacterium sp.]MDP3565520.1 hypothetical protein [Sediminibacterium sp.]
MITEVQYESLYAFCRKHYVQYYDVQVELVDHLSEAIEEKMNLNSKLSFEQALEIVYAGFGIKGFADIVATRMEMVSKKARKQKWKLFFSYFTVPKIALTLCLYAAVLLVGKFLTQDYYQGIFLFALGLAIFVFEIVHSIQTNKLFKSQKKAMIVTSERLSGIIHSGFFVQIFFSSSIFDYAEVKSMHFLSYALISLFMLIIFISILAHRDFIKELYKSALEQYPKAFA